MKVLNILKQIGILIIAGFLITVGVRIAEYTIPKPEIRVLVCYITDVDTDARCENLQELIDATKKVKLNEQS